MEAAESPSLYDRLGGVYSIATVVDEFIDRVMTDPRLNANPLVDEAHHRVLVAGDFFGGFSSMGDSFEVQLNTSSVNCQRLVQTRG